MLSKDDIRSKRLTETPNPTALPQWLLDAAVEPLNAISAQIDSLDLILVDEQDNNHPIPSSRVFLCDEGGCVIVAQATLVSLLFWIFLVQDDVASPFDPPDMIEFDKTRRPRTRIFGDVLEELCRDERQQSPLLKTVLCQSTNAAERWAALEKFANHALSKSAKSLSEFPLLLASLHSALAALVVCVMQAVAPHFHRHDRVARAAQKSGVPEQAFKWWSAIDGDEFAYTSVEPMFSNPGGRGMKLTEFREEENAEDALPVRFVYPISHLRMARIQLGLLHLTHEMEAESKRSRMLAPRDGSTFATEWEQLRRSEEEPSYQLRAVLIQNRIMKRYNAEQHPPEAAVRGFLQEFCDQSIIALADRLDDGNFLSLGALPVLDYESRSSEKSYLGYYADWLTTLQEVAMQGEIVVSPDENYGDGSEGCGG